LVNFILAPLKSNCPFCVIKDNGKQEIILSNEQCMFLQMPQEVLIGSGIIIPKQHRETVFDLTKEEWAGTYELLQEERYF
jgi:diadenosine tetraphosphate (Ap4A) HIT family hydrolase